MDHVVGRARATTDADLMAALRPALPHLQRIALGLTNDRHAADDLVADAIANVLPRWRDGAIDDPAAYLKRTILNLATRRWRRGALARARDHRAIEWTGIGPDLAGQAAERDATLRAIRTLPPRRRAIVVLRYYDDLPLDEIATLLGINLGTVKSQLSRALGQLGQTLGGQDR